MHHVPDEKLSLRQLQAELQRLLSGLVEPTKRKVWRETGELTTHDVASLLEQLREAKATGSEGGRGGRGRGTPLPISAEAVDLLAGIERDIVAVHNYAMDVDKITPEARARAAVDIASRWADVDMVAWMVNQLKLWTQEIRDLLDPPRRMTISAPCPACSETWVWRELADSGEVVRIPALQVDSHRGSVCLACGHRWPTTPDLEALAADLASTVTPERTRLRSGSYGNGGWPTTKPATATEAPEPAEETA